MKLAVARLRDDKLGDDVFGMRRKPLGDDFAERLAAGEHRCRENFHAIESHPRSKHEIPRWAYGHSQPIYRSEPFDATSLLAWDREHLRPMLPRVHECNEVLAALEAEVSDLIALALPAVQDYGRWQKVHLRASRIGTMLVRIAMAARERLHEQVDVPANSAAHRTLEAEQAELADCNRRFAAVAATIDAWLKRAASRLEPDGRS